jgi:hypothetical protein
MRLLAIDPGPEESGFVVYDTDARLVLEHGIAPNEVLLARCWRERDPADQHHLAIELIASYGMTVGKTVFDTCIWIGRFVEAWGAVDYTLVTRHEVKMHLCHTKNSSNSNVREALIDRWGGKAQAIGNKKAPGRLHGITSHAWSALAVAVTWGDAHAAKAAAERGVFA